MQEFMRSPKESVAFDSIIELKNKITRVFGEDPRKMLANANFSRDFIKSYENPGKEISNLISSHRKAQLLENRRRLYPIIETIILCGLQNFPIRGHRDDGKLVSESTTNEGNFRALLKFRVASGDNDLANHLQTTSSKATYISKTTQNELIDCCKEEIQESLIERVKNAKVYAIGFDETTESGHIEQLSLSLRYIYKGKIREDFITFVDDYVSIREEDIENQEKRLSGVALAHIVIDIIKKFGLTLEDCVGIATDGCSVMTSSLKGAVQEIIKICLNARYCPCFNHSLNNSLAKTSKVPQTRDCIATMKNIIRFANASPKRNKVFTNHLGESLSGLCETRWAEKHDGIIQFENHVTRMVTALEEISKWQDPKTTSDARSLIRSICYTEFIVSMISLSDVLSVTRPLSLLLQAPSIDLNQATEALKNTLNVLINFRNNAESHFSELFTKILSMAEQLKFDIDIPRLAKKQIYRENHPASSAKEYYRRTIFVSLLDHIVLDLQERLPKETLEVFDLNLLLQSKIIKNHNQEKKDNALKLVISLGERYKCFLGKSTVNLKGEYEPLFQLVTLLAKEAFQLFAV
ncbi:unnamed protein product [Brassicogethes aeneus]|uniref:DUF4371 domain-containing protein n=1 Tax=Brassicogethes aeneus TaxID=1431903 RepID=A0A9P0B0C0_BRAAE|nr:unnamed protein product [Brassicogethes aeneus]